MKLLLLGKNGQVGWELQRALVPLGDLTAVDYEDCDLRDPASVAGLFATVKPDVTVNAAAYTSVDKAEAEPEHAHAINAIAPGILARESARIGSWLVYYSTDYVFDGSGRKPRREREPARPLNVYGRTKLAGEQAIQESGCRHLIFRTSWVYAARGDNFVKSILRLAQKREKLTIVDDQIGAPTGADLLADITAHAIRMTRHRPEIAGLYHLTARGEVSWFEYACFVLETARKFGFQTKTGPEMIERVSTADYPTRAIRPLNSRLDNDKLQRTLGLQLPEWQDGVVRMLHEICDRGL